MAFYKQDIVDINLNTGSIFRSFLNHSIGFKNDDADRFGIRCFRDGEPVDLSGASCQAVFMAPNGVNIALTSYGTVSGNVAYVTLPPACYDYEGQFCLSIQLVGGGVTGTMRIVDGMVVNTGASGAVAPTASVPTYQEIISQYNAMVAATSAANLAIAETFDATKAYPAGKYVINDGHLYRLTADHAANVTWANTSKVTTNFGDDLSSLKSATTQSILTVDNSIVPTDWHIVEGSTTTITDITNGIRIENTNTWGGIFYKIGVIPNTNYNVTFDLSITSGRCNISLVPFDRSTTLKAKLYTASVNDILFQFNSGDYSCLMVGLQNPIANGDISITNFKIAAEGQLQDVKNNQASGKFIDIVEPYREWFIDGHYRMYSSGAVYDESTYCMSPLILVEEGGKYTISNSTNPHISFYDKDGTYKSGTLSKEFTIPSGCCYMCVSIKISEKNSVVVKNVNSIQNVIKLIPPYGDIIDIGTGKYLAVGQLPSGSEYGFSGTEALCEETSISNARKVTDITFKVRVVGKFLVGLFTKSDSTGTITHMQTVTATATGLIRFIVDFELDPTKTYYTFIAKAPSDSGVFGYSGNNKQSKYYSFSTSGISVGSSVSITQQNNGLGLTQTGAIFVSFSENKGFVTVAKFGGDYTSIGEAVANTTDETIIIYPGVYEEVVLATSGRHFIGIDRESCIIKTTTGKYADAPMKVYGNFYVENLTMIATAEDAGSWYPTWVIGDNTTYASYAIHIDGNATGNENKTGIVRNCTFYSECNNAVGAGAQVDYTLILENCEIIRKVTDEHYISPLHDGAIACHSPNTQTGDTGSHFVMRDCTVVNETLEKALQLYKVFGDSPFTAEIKGCTFKDSLGIDNVVNFKNCTNSMITNMSHGNSTDECNYRAIHA